MNNDNKISEQSIFDALVGAANFRANNGTRKIKIERANFSFCVQGVDEDRVLKCRKLATKNRGRNNESTDWSKYASYLIYNATTPEDRKTLWDNRDVWQALDCVCGADVVFKCLTPAERAKVVSIIETLSGYDDNEVDLDATIENF